MMTSIGVDLHKDSLTAVVLDAHGTLLQRRDIPTKCRLQIQQFFGSFAPPTQVAVESVGFYQWFWNLVRPLVSRLVLADPAAVRAHLGRKTKTDGHDAHLLATLLREDRLPMAFVPQESVRSLRELVRHRHSVARSLARERRALRWLLLKNNLPGPRTLDSAAAQKWLLSFEDKLSAVHRFAARHRNHVYAAPAIAIREECDPRPIRRPARRTVALRSVGQRARRTSIRRHQPQIRPPVPALHVNHLPPIGGDTRILHRPPCRQIGRRKRRTGERRAAQRYPRNGKYNPHNRSLGGACFSFPVPPAFRYTP